MATSNNFLTNATTRHAIFVQRHAGAIVKDLMPYLEQIRKVTLGALGREVSTLSKKKLNKLLKDINIAIKDINAELSKDVISKLKEFSVYEADFSAKMFTKATDATFNVPASVTVQAAAISQPLLLTKEKLGVKEALREFDKAKRKEITRIIKDGVIAGATNAVITEQLEDITTKLQPRQASALVRTLTNHVSTVARDITMRENEDIIDGYRWVSTLDGRTTSTCQSLDGKVFSNESGNPKPPLHWRCRSTIIPVVKKEYSIVERIKSERAAKGSAGAESVPGQSTYNSWFKQQSSDFQDEVLGTKKGKLFREGGLSVYKFVDDDYNPLTLDELRKREPLAFEKAGL